MNSNDSPVYGIEAENVEVSSCKEETNSIEDVCCHVEIQEDEGTIREVIKGGLYKDNSDIIYRVISLATHVFTRERLVIYRVFGDQYLDCMALSEDDFLCRFHYYGSSNMHRWEIMYAKGISTGRRYEVSPMAGHIVATSPKEYLRCTSFGPAHNGLYAGAINLWKEGKQEEMLFRSEPYFKTRKVACSNMRRLVKKIKSDNKDFNSR